jgi:serine/threonine protein phosphatase 1
MRRPHPSQSTRKAALPPDTRIYAIGDIHGRSDLLRETIATIDDDLRRRPITYAAEVYLGDYIDRGADSKGVLDILTARMADNNVICLRGNHEAVLEDFLDDAKVYEGWRQIGALPTLASYGLSVPKSATAADVQRALLAVFPYTHEVFLHSLRNSIRCGDYLFVHAGLRPNVALSAQDPYDLIWIREDFLNSTINHGVFVVHGHTPVPHPDIRANRINIDTGAYRSGVLTCIAIEGSEILVL